MKNNMKLAVVVPAYDEQLLIRTVIEGIPDYIDHIIVVDDVSKDDTAQIVQSMISADDNRLILIRHEKNQGVGGAIASGYKWARDNDIDVAVVMAGDNQMDPADLEIIMAPVLEGRADYSKANRLFTGEAYKVIPKVRYFGNAILSMFTKIASGYWHVADSQSGYTAINRRALELIDWDEMYKRYGQPNDLLVRLNVFDLKVADIPSKPVYGVGEKSNINIGRVTFTIGWLLIKMFLWRLKEKYIIRDFHPLVFFYLLSFLLMCTCGAFTVRLFMLWSDLGSIPEITLLLVMFSGTLSLFSLFFAMWFDMERNKDLKP